MYEHDNCEPTVRQKVSPMLTVGQKAQSAKETVAELTLKEVPMLRMGARELRDTKHYGDRTANARVKQLG